MSKQLAHDTVTGPLGTFSISTIQTFMGGGGDNKPSLAPFSESDYADETPWPFETMIFRAGSSTGLYHAPYSTKAEALAGHKSMIETIKAGTEFGGGVRGDWGTPSTTAEEWKSRQAAKEQRT